MKRLERKLVVGIVRRVQNEGYTLELEGFDLPVFLYQLRRRYKLHFHSYFLFKAHRKEREYSVWIAPRYNITIAPTVRIERGDIILDCWPL